MSVKQFRPIYHDATLSRFAITGDSLWLFVELNSSAGRAGGLATLTFEGVANVDDVRRNLESRDRPAEIAGVIFDRHKPSDARHCVIIDLTPSPALRVRCRSVHEA
ncbi:MAG: hypothetical protein ACAI43_22155 [Phycisphaerae bacterium]